MSSNPIHLRRKPQPLAASPRHTYTDSQLLPGDVSRLWGKKEGRGQRKRRIMLGLRKAVSLDIQQEGHG